MDDKTKRIADGLAKAMKAEHDGQYFYLSAAGNTSDPQGREVFAALAEEEADHYRFLKAQHESLKPSGRIDPNITLGKQVDLSGDSPIFSNDIKDRIKDANYEMSALSIGIQLEQNAVAFYTSEAHAVDDPEVRGFYTMLAEWERGHLDALVRQETALKEDFWYESGFAPF